MISSFVSRVSLPPTFLIHEHVPCSWQWTRNIQAAFDKNGNTLRSNHKPAPEIFNLECLPRPILFAGWEAPVQYTLAPLTDIFNFPKLWPAEFRPSLKRIQAALYKYITDCAANGNTAFHAFSKSSCTPDPDECVVGETPLRVWGGTYGLQITHDEKTNNKQRSTSPLQLLKCAGSYSRNGVCASCYDSPQNGIGPGCSPATAVSCTSTVCYCKPSVVRNAPS